MTKLHKKSEKNCIWCEIELTGIRRIRGNVVERDVRKVLSKATGRFREPGSDLCQRGVEGVD